MILDSNTEIPFSNKVLIQIIKNAPPNTDSHHTIIRVPSMGVQPRSIPEPTYANTKIDVIVVIIPTTTTGILNSVHSD